MTRHIATLLAGRRKISFPIGKKKGLVPFAESGGYGRGVVGGNKFQLGGPVSMTNGFLENRWIEIF